MYCGISGGWVVQIIEVYSMCIVVYLGVGLSKLYKCMVCVLWYIWGLGFPNYISVWYVYCGISGGWVVQIM